MKLLVQLIIALTTTTSFACSSKEKSSEKIDSQKSLQVHAGLQKSQSEFGTYPDHWWKPVPEKDLASWEIPPQAADRSKNEVILSKRNELGMFSNFYAAKFVYQNQTFASMEGFWQSMKYPENATDPRNSDLVTWPYTRDQVAMMVDREAKKAGDLANKNMEKLGINWITYRGEKIDYKGKDQKRHYELVFAATYEKIQQNEDIKQLLLKTGNLKLMADHHQKPDSPPAYDYPAIAMKIRSQLSEK